MELAELGVEAVADSLAMIGEGKRPIPQSSDGVTLAKKISKEECEIDWFQDAQIVVQKVRAFTSVPGAWTRFRGDTLKIDTLSITDHKFAASTIHIVGKDLLIGTGSQAISVGYVTPAGKSRMEALSWVNGARLSEGDHFG
jgi:methionyl-tRNA formyltransferase